MDIRPLEFKGTLLGFTSKNISQMSHVFNDGAYGRNLHNGGAISFIYDIIAECVV